MGKREYTAEYKAKIVMEVLREEQHISEIAAREGISRTQLQNWKREFVENAGRVFSKSKQEREARQLAVQAEQRESELMKKVGQLTIENDWLKKKSAQIIGPDWERASGFKK